MYYLTTYTYFEQIKHKHKLGFKYNEIETLIIIFKALNIAHKIIEWLKSEDFKKYLNNFKEVENESITNI